MNDWLKINAWSLTIAAATMISTFAIYGVRIQNVEDQQERQSAAITAIQTSLANQQSQYAVLDAKITGISANVDYIRSRIDKATDQ